MIKLIVILTIAVLIRCQDEESEIQQVQKAPPTGIPNENDEIKNL